jgi:tetratricopeptide (TPR) repeat protein
MDRENNRRRTISVCVLLTVATLASFWPVVRCDFINFDDLIYVVENPAVQAGFTWKTVVWAFTTDCAANWHPLTWLSHMLDAQLFGLNPGGHHLTSLLLHTANTLLLFFLLRQMTGALWRSGFVAALFALHPLHVESVAWISERKDVLSTFFFLLALLAYARYAKRSASGIQFKTRQPKTQTGESVAAVRSRKSGVRNPESEVLGTDFGSKARARQLWYPAALLFFVLGLMSKPMVVTLPFILLLLDYWPLQRLEFNTASLKLKTLPPLFIEKLPFFALAAASCLVTFMAQKNLGAVAGPGYFPPSTRVLNALVSYALYLRKMIWPSDLAVFYPYPSANLPELAAESLVVLAGLSVLAFVNLRKRPWLAVGWLWYLGTLVPVIGIVQVGAQALADRYTYIPLIGIFIGITWGAADLATAWPRGKIALAAAALMVAGICGGLASRQASQWKNSETLFCHALAATTDNMIAHNQLGIALAAQGKNDEAAIHFAEAVRIQPHYLLALDNLGLSLVKQGKLEEGMGYCRAALAINPRNAKVHFNLGLALAMEGKLKESLPEYEAACRLDPASVHFRVVLAEALVRDGKTNEAAGCFQEALRLQPNFAQAHWRYGMSLAYTGNLKEALDHLREAIRLQPAVPIYLDLASVLTRAGQSDAAVTQYRNALRLQPDSPPALTSLAWVLAVDPSDRIRSGPEAVTLAERACRLTRFRDPSFLGTLAAAYAEAGRFEDAIRTAGQARDLAHAAGNQQLADRNQQLLEMYRAGKPFHERVQTLKQ